MQFGKPPVRGGSLFSTCSTCLNFIHIANDNFFVVNRSIFRHCLQLTFLARLKMGSVYFYGAVHT